MAISHKCSEEAKTSIPYDMKEELKAEAHEAGCDFAEYLRDMIYMWRKGMTFGEHVANHRRSVMTVKGPINGDKTAKP